mmetsp:Transcript_58423/g.92338  ORF Transcript_58423/g.92338 Transcript_58423/m.92338 type:complete len:89 (-) Transcript_58423:48-314(-)
MFLAERSLHIKRIVLIRAKLYRHWGSFLTIRPTSARRVAPAARQQTHNLLHEVNCLRHLRQLLVESGKKYGARTALQILRDHTITTVA